MNQLNVKGSQTIKHMTQYHNQIMGGNRRLRMGHHNHTRSDVEILLNILDIGGLLGGLGALFKVCICASKFRTLILDGKSGGPSSEQELG